MKNRFCYVLSFFVLLSLSPMFGLSDEAMALLAKLKNGGTASAPLEIGRVGSIVAEQPIESLTASSTSLAGKTKCKLAIGSSKDDVVRILGKPDSIQRAGNKTIFHYGNPIVAIESERLVLWSGFSDNDPRFFPKRIRKGCDKEDVIHVFGKPLYEGADFFKYGLNSCIRFRDGKVMDWSGFSPGNASFSAEVEPDSSRSTKRRNSTSGNNSSPRIYSSSDSFSGQPRLSNGDYSIHTGPRGGKYHISASGKKVYHSKKRR